jgi:hypothetical protein
MHRWTALTRTRAGRRGTTHRTTPVRAAAHFGRAMHYAQAFGGPLKRAREAYEADQADKADGYRPTRVAPFCAFARSIPKTTT